MRRFATAVGEVAGEVGASIGTALGAGVVGLARPGNSFVQSKETQCQDEAICARVSSLHNEEHGGSQGAIQGRAMGGYRGASGQDPNKLDPSRGDPMIRNSKFIDWREYRTYACRSTY